MFQKTCRVLIGLGLFLAVVTFQAQLASAQVPVDASTFAAQCNASGTLVLNADTHVKGGTGVLSRDCVVQLADDVRLKITAATLTAGSTIRLRIGGGNRSEVRITGSSMIAVGGELTISPGVSFLILGMNFDDATVHISNSILLSGSSGVSVGASFNGNRGIAKVVNSTLRAASGNAVFVTASCSQSPTGFCTGGFGTDGTVQVVDSTLDAGSGIVDIETHSLGKTTVVNSTLVGGALTIHAGPGGSCKSKQNSPPVPCT